MAYGGASGKQIATCLGLGWVCAAVATAYNRGYFTRYFEELSTQDSESSLAVINQSQKNRVKPLPMNAAPGASDSNTLVIETAHAAASAVVDSAVSEGVAVDVTSAAAASAAAAAATTGGALSAIKSAALQAKDTAKQGFVSVVTWASENPKTAILMVGLLYALQYEYRTNRAHEHYEGRLRQEERLKKRREEVAEEAKRRAAGGAAVSAADAATAEDGSSDGNALNRSKTYGGFAGASSPSAVAGSPTAAGAAHDDNCFATSTWDSRARPVRVDSEFEKLVAALPQTALEEYTSTLLNINFMDVEERKWIPEFAAKVKEQVLSVAPPQGVRGVVREGSGFLRFLHVASGEYNKAHGEILFAVQTLQNELREKRRVLKSTIPTDSQ